MTYGFYAKSLTNKTAKRTNETGVCPCLLQLCLHRIIASYCLAMKSTPMLKSPVKTILTQPCQVKKCPAKTVSWKSIKVHNSEAGGKMQQHIQHFSNYFPFRNHHRVNIKFLPVRVISLDTLSIASTASAPSSQASMKNFSGVVCLRGQRDHLELPQYP